MYLLPAQRIRQARVRLQEQAQVMSEFLQPHVSRSWQRSLNAGLSPIGRISTLDNLSAYDIKRLCDANHDLINHAQPVMAFLQEQVKHTQSVVVLSDAKGVLMHTQGDLDFLDKVQRVSLLRGASWHESHRGTNAIGTALAERSEIEIHGAEHFLERNGFLTCAATPLWSASGQLMGVLDISGDSRRRHPHTLSLVSTAARMIENSLIMASARDHVLVQLHPQVHGVGSIAQGLLLFSHDGWLLGANRQALEQLSLSMSAIASTQWSDLFAIEWEDWLSKSVRQQERALQLHTLQGQALFAKVQSRLSYVSRSSGAQQKNALQQLDTGDKQWRQAADKAQRVYGKDIAVLIQGESGVGKELFAKALHDSGVRRTQPFVAINCAALPEHLIESELFGYVAGAFTGAAKNGAIGRIRQANGGTLFLDEIGDMPLSLQSRLLRVLQERVVTPLGSAQNYPVDFSLICATHCVLKDRVQEQRFRSDLYYRINGMTVVLPALREREDFAALTQRMLHQLSDGQAVSIEPELFQALSRYPWPGNLRQYSHVLKTALALLDANASVIDWTHLPDDIQEELHALRYANEVHEDTPPQNLHDLSVVAIQKALENARGNVSAAARQLGISRQTLYRKLQTG